MPEKAERLYPNAARCGARLRAVRDARGLTVTAVARMAGFTQQQVSAVELGQINTPIETLTQIAQALGVGLQEIVLSSGATASDFMQMTSVIAWVHKHAEGVARDLEAMSATLKAIDWPNVPETA